MHNEQWIRSISISQVRSTWTYTGHKWQMCAGVSAQHTNIYWLYGAIVLQSYCETMWMGKETRDMKIGACESLLRSGIRFFQAAVAAVMRLLLFCISSTLDDNASHVHLFTMYEGYSIYYIIDAQFLWSQHQFEVLLPKILPSLKQWFHCLTLSKYPNRVDELLM